MTYRTIARITALTVVLSAGTAVAQARTAPNDPNQPQRDSMTPRGDDRSSQSQLFLHRTDTLIGSELHNRTGEEIGSIEDFIVERGSGQITFAIVEIGGVLGMGGNEFALPYERLSWNQSGNRFVVNMTKEEAQAHGEFLPENWSDFQHTTWMERITGWEDSKNYEEAATERAIMAATGRTDAEEIRGRVVDIRREDERTDSDVVTVDIETTDGKTREVVLGPSWYITGHNAAPMRGQTIVIKARKHDGHYYGWSAGERGNEMILRNEQGRSAWHQDRELNRDDKRETNRTERDSRPGDRTDRYPDSKAATNAPTRYILLSDLIHTDAKARGISSGEIEGALIERRSGRVAFLLFDPNDNFLGIGDTVSMVPWSVVYINREMKVNLDADATAFTNAMEVPDDLETLRSSAAVEPAYCAFQVRPTQFRDRSTNRDGTQREGQREGWGDRPERTDRQDQPDSNRPTNDRPQPGRQP